MLGNSILLRNKLFAFHLIKSSMPFCEVSVKTLEGYSLYFLHVICS